MAPAGGSIEDIRIGVVARLRARRAELVERIFVRVRDDAFGQAGARDEEYAAGLRLAVAAAVEYVLEGIEDELARAVRSPEQRRTERVRGLLASDTTIERSEVAELGYELDAWHLGAIARGAGAREAVDRLAVRVGCRALCVASGEETVWAWLGGQHRLEMAALERALSGLGEVAFAVGEPARDLAGWRLTHRQAQAALMVALRRPRPLTRYADVALLAAVLKDRALAQALIDVYLVPLEDSRGGGPVLHRTLRAYLDAERSVSSAAARLGVVRKTVENRLRTIEERLGRTLHPAPAELEVALLLDELVPASGPAEVQLLGELVV